MKNIYEEDDEEVHRKLSDDSLSHLLIMNNRKRGKSQLSANSDVSSENQPQNMRRHSVTGSMRRVQRFSETTLVRDMQNHLLNMGFNHNDI